LGLIGSAIARRLVALGAEVLLIDSMIPEYGGNLANIADIRDRVLVNIADIRGGYGLRHLLEGRDFLFNLAAQTSHLDSMSSPEVDLAINSRRNCSCWKPVARSIPPLRSCMPAHGRFTAARNTCRSTSVIRCGLSTSMASTRWRARPIT
jgi:hypothetical protein